MTLYVGEQIRISTKAREYALRGATGVLITDDNVTSVKITILNKNQSVRINEADMEWNEDEGIWQYKWDTSSGSPAVSSGTYRYRITVVGADGKPSIEWGTIRLARQPTIV
jgi:flagellar hook assembly protein FlgD